MDKREESVKPQEEKIRVVLFDFGGVLDEEGWKNGWMAIADANGIDGEKVVEEAADMAYETGYLLGKGTWPGFWKVLQEKTGIAGNAAESYQMIFSGFILRKSMINCVRKLKARGLSVAILSDQIEMLDALNARDDFFKEFDHVFNSYHLGKGKRDASLFDDIARRLNSAPGAIAFVDDSPGHVERARQKGMKAILYTESKTFCRQMQELGLFKGSEAGKSS